MNGLNERQLEVLQQEPITKQAMKETGLTFDELMKVRLTLSEDPLHIGSSLLCWTGAKVRDHIRSVVDFAILRWFYSPESHLPEFERWREAASQHVHMATLGTFADDGNAVQRGREKGAAETNRKKDAETSKKIEKAAKIWRELEQTGRPEHERVAVIAQRIQGAKPDTIRRWLKKAGLR